MYQGRAGVDNAGLVQGTIADKKIVQIASGNAHSLALDDKGYVYAWGYNGYCRLGLGDQKDRYVFRATNTLRALTTQDVADTGPVLVE